MINNLTNASLPLDRKVHTKIPTSSQTPRKAFYVNPQISGGKEVKGMI